MAAGRLAVIARGTGRLLGDIAALILDQGAAGHSSFASRDGADWEGVRQTLRRAVCAFGPCDRWPSSSPCLRSPPRAPVLAQPLQAATRTSRPNEPPPSGSPPGSPPTRPFSTTSSTLAASAARATR